MSSVSPASRASTVRKNQLQKSLLHSQWGEAPLFFGRDSPLRAPASRVLRTCFQATNKLHARPSVTNGVCLVGPNGVGKSSVLRLAEAAVRDLLPQMHVVAVDAADAYHCTQELDWMEERRWAKPVEWTNGINGTNGTNGANGTAAAMAVFVGNVHLLQKPAWRTLRNLLTDTTGPDGQVRAHTCVVAAGDDHPYSWIKDWLQPLSEHMQTVRVSPLRTSDQYRAFRKHVQRHYHDSTHAAPIALANAIDTWHLHTGGRFASIRDELSARFVCGAHHVQVQERPFPAGLKYANAAIECLCWLRKKMNRARFGAGRTGACIELDPFMMDSVTLTRFQIERLVADLSVLTIVADDVDDRHKMDVPTDVSVDEVIDNLVASDILRVATPTATRIYDKCDVEYTFGFPSLAITADELHEVSHHRARNCARLAQNPYVRAC